MARHRLILPVAALFATFIIGGVLGYYLKATEIFLNRMGQPVVYQDVTDSTLQNFGMPFARPPGASHVIAAAVGNGAGDTVWYAGLELPDRDAIALLMELKSKGELRPARCIPKGYYLDQLTPKFAEQLWPRDKISLAHLYLTRKGYLAYVPGKASIHVFGFPDAEALFDDPTVVDGSCVSNPPVPQGT